MVTRTLSSRYNLKAGKNRASRLFVRDSALFVFLVIMLTANIDLMTWRSVQVQDVSSQGSLFSQVTAVILFCVSIYLMIVERVSLRRILFVAAPVLPLIIWVLLSVTWSDFPDISVRRGVRLALDTITAILLAAGYRDQYSLLRVIYLSFAFILAADIAFLGIPSISFTPIGYQGVHDSKEASGLFSLLAFPVFFAAIIDRRIFSSRLISLFGIFGCLIILTISLCKSAQGLAPVCFILICILFLLARASASTVSVVTVMSVLLATLTTMVVVSIGLSEVLNFTVGDASLTGRDQIWKHSLALFWQSPIIGRGYGAVWNVGNFSLLEIPQLSEVFLLKGGHNGYLDVMTESGIIGLILTIIFLVSIVYRLLVRMPCINSNRINLIALFTFFAITLEDIVVSNIFRAGSGFWVYFLIVTHAAIFLGLRRPLAARQGKLNRYSGQRSSSGVMEGAPTAGHIYRSRTLTAREYTDGTLRVANSS
jgi:exopolysaccharide production protein ExoQ